VEKLTVSAKSSLLAIQNPKFEIRNSKQIRNSNETQIAQSSNFGIRICFEFRDSSFEFVRTRGSRASQLCANFRGLKKSPKVYRLRTGLNPHRIDQLATLEITEGRGFKPKAIINSSAGHGINQFLE
jgi:hypothetical protein